MDMSWKEINTGLKEIYDDVAKRQDAVMMVKVSQIIHAVGEREADLNALVSSFRRQDNVINALTGFDQ